MSTRIIIYAPNLHAGGGLVLLEELIGSIPHGLNCKYYLDARAKQLIFTEIEDVVWVRPSLLSRLIAEINLSRNSKYGDATLFLHSLPPIFFNRGRKILYLHNKLLINQYFPFFNYPIKVSTRIFLERGLFRFFITSINEVVVQTASMKSKFCISFPSMASKVAVLPFAAKIKIFSKIKKEDHKFDLIYNASPDHHKNHINLFEALKILKKEGLSISLAVTIPSHEAEILKLISDLNSNYSLDIINLGILPHLSILSCYRDSRALIYPSTEESFGLPLVEAQYLGLPILASELDYVRDVCQPAETFDPLSPISISRAIKRFFCFSDGQNIAILDGPSFVKEFLKKVNYCE
jgi:glycosyltransferase involved in cell wall biosynthesis